MQRYCIDVHTCTTLFRRICPNSMLCYLKVSNEEVVFHCICAIQSAINSAGLNSYYTD